jgi:arginine decarboxylase-like protein
MNTWRFLSPGSMCCHSRCKTLSASLGVSRSKSANAYRVNSWSKSYFTLDGKFSVSVSRSRNHKS